MKKAKYMNSKFDSTCNACGRDIFAGERIFYKGRSVAECSDCMPPENGAPITAANRNASKAASGSAADWASVLAWDENDPVPGASIGAAGDLAARAQERAAAEITPGEREVKRKAAEAAERERVRQSAITPSDSGNVAQIDASRSLAADLAAIGDASTNDAPPAIVAQTAVQAAAADTDSAPEFTQSERAEGMTIELMLILINAITVAGFSGRYSLAQYCIEQGRNSESAERAALWAGFARAIQS